MDHDELAFTVALANLNSRIARFAADTIDGGVSTVDDVSLGRDLTVLGGAVRRYTLLRSVSWGHTHLEPDLWHVRAPEPAAVVDGATVGPGICAAWLVGDLPLPDTWDFAACPECLTALGRRPAATA